LKTFADDPTAMSESIWIHSASKNHASNEPSCNSYENSSAMSSVFDTVLLGTRCPPPRAMSGMSERDGYPPWRKDPRPCLSSHGLPGSAAASRPPPERKLARGRPREP
jgi:hypothetical protein